MKIASGCSVWMSFSVARRLLIAALVFSAIGCGSGSGSKHTDAANSDGGDATPSDVVLRDDAHPNAETGLQTEAGPNDAEGTRPDSSMADANATVDSPVTTDAGPDSSVMVDSSASGAGDASGDAEDDASLAMRILKNLGVKEISQPPAATYSSSLGDQTIDPSQWHPLKKSETVFRPRSQIFQAGFAYPTSTGYMWNGLYKDSMDSPPYGVAAAVLDDQLWEQGAAKTSIAADIDGDGIAEIVIFYVRSTATKDLLFRVYKNGTFSAESKVENIVLSGLSFKQWQASKRKGVGTPWFPYFSSSKGDLVDDGTDTANHKIKKDEVILVDYNAVYVFSINIDAQGNASAVLRDAKQFGGSLCFNCAVSSVAAGDFDGDRQDELVIGLAGGDNQPGALYAFYDSTFAMPSTNPEVATLDKDGAFVEAAFGNFAGNNLAQLALCTTNKDGEVVVYMVDSPAPGSKLITIAPKLTSIIIKTHPWAPADPLIGESLPNFFRILPRAVNLTAEPKDQLQILGYVYKDPMSRKPAGTNPTAEQPDFAIWDPNTWDLASENTLVDVQVGDLNNDGKQDLVYLSVNQASMPTIQVFGLNSNSQLALQKALCHDPPFASVDKFGTSTTIAVGNFADNGLHVKYAGHELKFTDPIVIAVIASAPYFSDIAQEDMDYAKAYSSWDTTFGTITGDKKDESTSVGFSVGTLVEFEHEVTVPILGLNITKFKASWDFTNTNTWEWDTSREVKKTQVWKSPAGQDSVVFTSVPIDVYKYEIKTSPDPNNPAGKSIYIHIPRSYATYMVSRDFFNQAIGTGVINPIDSTVLGHTIGKPFTYPTVGQKNAIMTAMSTGVPWFLAPANPQDYQFGPVPVSQGEKEGGTVNLEIRILTEDSAKVSHDFSNEFAVGAGTANVTVSLKAGFDTGYSATSTTLNGTEFGGTIGYLPTKYYTNQQYTYQSGLFAYSHSMPSGKNFWVVDYWVEK
jgi:hypothetical protein